MFLVVRPDRRGHLVLPAPRLQAAGHRSSRESRISRSSRTRFRTAARRTSVDRTPEFAWIPVLVIVGLAAIAIGGVRRRRAKATATARARRRGSSRGGRRAARRQPRRPSRGAGPAAGRHRRVRPPRTRARQRPAFRGVRAETAEEYVTRILGRLEVERDPSRGSPSSSSTRSSRNHDVDEAMKDEAIGALAEIRDELRAAASRKAAERLLASPPESESAAPS